MKIIELYNEKVEIERRVEEIEKEIFDFLSLNKDKGIYFHLKKRSNERVFKVEKIDYKKNTLIGTMYDRDYVDPYEIDFDCNEFKQYRPVTEDEALEIIRNGKNLIGEHIWEKIKNKE